MIFISILYKIIISVHSLFKDLLTILVIDIPSLPNESRVSRSNSR